MTERNELFEILCTNLKQSGNWDKVTMLPGGYYNNFVTVVNYIKEIMKNGKN